MGDAKRRAEWRKQNGGPEEPDRMLIDIRPDQSTDVFANLPPGTTQEGYMKFLERNWELMGAFAFESFLHEGRGVLVLDWDLSLDKRLNLLSPELKRLNQIDRVKVFGEFNCPIFYVGESSPMVRAGGRDILSEDMWGLAARYKPEVMIVLLLCWGFVDESNPGSIMGRTIVLPGLKDPMAAYIERGNQFGDFSFMVGTNEKPRAPIQSRIVRAFEANVGVNASFRRSLRNRYDQGREQDGPGVLCAIPNEEADGMNLIYLPMDMVHKALGSDPPSNPYQQLLFMLENGDPDEYVVAIAVDEKRFSQENFTYYALAFRIPKEVK